jgi:hypothetical protein
MLHQLGEPCVLADHEHGRADSGAALAVCVPVMAIPLAAIDKFTELRCVKSCVTSCFLWLFVIN